MIILNGEKNQLQFNCNTKSLVHVSQIAFIILYDGRILRLQFKFEIN